MLTVSASSVTRYEIRYTILYSSHLFYFIPVFPVQDFFSVEIDLVVVNGSNSTGKCSNSIHSNTRQTCTTPTGSVLFDGNVPMLNGLDGDMWASQLLTINTTANTTKITFDFTHTSDYIY